MSGVKTVKVELSVPKESKEVVDFLTAILKKVKAKAPMADYADLLDEGYAAVSGVDKLADEAKSEYRDDLAGYLVKEVMEEMLPVKAAAPSA